MTEQQIPSTSGPSTAPPRAANGAGPVRSQGATNGWVRFGGVLMVVVGVFAVIEGLFALFLPTTYVATSQTVVTLTFTGWGWLHIILGALVAVVGAALLREDVPGWARVTAIVLVTLNVLVQLTWLPAYPIWSILMIVLDIIIIGALVALADRRAWSA